MIRTALILVDLQNDFCPGGALAVEDGDQVIPVANDWLSDHDFEKVIATQDWHPQNHQSFASNHPGHNVGDIVMVEGLDQILWPDHCVQNSEGAKLHSKLKLEGINKVVKKGMNPLFDSYSAFFDNGYRTKTDLDNYLQSFDIRRLFVMGLATDYCVKYTVLDARKLGYEVCLIEDGCRGVNLSPDDSDDAIDLMKSRGAILI